jgi:L-rhamnose-H+ transport protein
MPNPFLGVGLHAVGGAAAGSFYVPFKRVRDWAWESYWLISGVFAWVVAPAVGSTLTVPATWQVLSTAPHRAILLAYLFGVLWGIGGLTFGLTMRYLGLSLGYAVALGFCAVFGTLVPPVVSGKIAAMMSDASGLIVLAGVALCVAGIVVCARAGVRKETEVSAEEKKETIQEFSLGKGLLIGAFAGVMSACMAFGIAAGKPIADMALKTGIQPVFQNNPLFIVIFAGGFTTNFIWCVALNIHNKTGCNYFGTGLPSGSVLLANYLFSALAGVTWYFQFFFYGMGTTQMGRYDFSSWTIHMAFIIVFSNLWGISFREWRGVTRHTMRLVWAGIAVLILSTIVIGTGNAWETIYRLVGHRNQVSSRDNRTCGCGIRSPG